MAKADIEIIEKRVKALMDKEIGECGLEVRAFSGDHPLDSYLEKPERVGKVFLISIKIYDDGFFDALYNNFWVESSSEEDMKKFEKFLEKKCKEFVAGSKKAKEKAMKVSKDCFKYFNEHLKITDKPTYTESVGVMGYSFCELSFDGFVVKFGVHPDNDSYELTCENGEETLYDCGGGGVDDLIKYSIKEEWAEIAQSIKSFKIVPELPKMEMLTAVLSMGMFYKNGAPFELNYIERLEYIEKLKQGKGKRISDSETLAMLEAIKKVATLLSDKVSDEEIRELFTLTNWKG